MGWASVSSPLSSARLARLLPGVLTRALIGGKLNPQTTAETAAGLVPVDYSQPSDTSLLRSSRYKAGATWDYRADQRQFEIDLSRYGAVFNGTSDDAPAIADAINAAYARVGSGGPRRVIMPSGGLTAKVNTAGVIKLYCGAVGVDFNGLTLDASGIGSGVVISGTGRGSAPYTRYSEVASIENLVVLGDTTAGNTAVLLALAGASGFGEVTGSWLRGISLHGGSTGLSIGAYTYILKLDGLTIMDQIGKGIDYPGATQSGENINLHGCNISNVVNGGTGVGISLGNAGTGKELHLHGCSVDYCDQLFSIEEGQVELFGCHLESSYTANPFVSISHGVANASTVAFRMFGGALALTEAGDTLASIIGVDSSGGPILVRLACQVASYGKSALLIDQTAGTSLYYDLTGTRVEGNVISVGGVLNGLYNGNFELGTLAGFITSGAGYTFSADSSNPHSGTYAMKAVSTGGSGSATQARSVKPGQQVLAESYVDVSVYTSGTVEVLVNFYSDSGFTQKVGGYTLASYSAATSGYQHASAAYPVPQGANYALITVEGNPFAGTFFADDLILTPV